MKEDGKRVQADKSNEVSTGRNSRQRCQLEGKPLIVHLQRVDSVLGDATAGSFSLRCTLGS